MYSYIGFTGSIMNLQELWTTIHANSQNLPISPIFLQKSCIVPYNSWFYIFRYPQTLSKYSQNPYFHHFWSFFGMTRLEFENSYFDEWFFILPNKILNIICFPLSCVILDSSPIIWSRTHENPILEESSIRFTVQETLIRPIVDNYTWLFIK